MNRIRPIVIGLPTSSRDRVPRLLALQRTSGTASWWKLRMRPHQRELAGPGRQYAYPEHGKRINRLSFSQVPGALNAEGIPFASVETP